MKTTLALILSLVGAATLQAAVPAAVVQELRKDVEASMAVDGRKPVKDVVDKALNEAVHVERGRDIFRFSDEELAAFNAGQPSVTDAVFDATWKKFHAAARDAQIPKLLTFYDKEQRAKRLTTNQKTLCYRILLSALRHLDARKAEQDEPQQPLSAALFT